MHRFGLVRSLSAAARRLWRDRRGNYSMIVVLLLPVLTGFVGVGTEMGLWLYDQQAEQTAADSAAFSAAIYYRDQSPVQTGDTTSGPNGQAQAFAVVANYGFTAGPPSCATAGGSRTCVAPANCSIDAPGTAAACVQVSNPPLAGARIGDATAFEVIVAQSPQQLFSKVLMSAPAVIKARAVAYVAGGTTQTQTQTTTQVPCAGASCVCLKVTNATNVAETADFSGAASLALNGCSLEVDDTGNAGLTLSGGATVSASNIYLANTTLDYQLSGATCNAATQSSAKCSAVSGLLSAPPPGGFGDPYQTQLMQNPANPPIPIITAGQTTSCTGASAVISSGGRTVTPGFYTTMRFTGNAILAPGVYFICPSGNVLISGSAILSTAPFLVSGTLPAGCTSPYTACANGTVPFAAGDGVTIVLLGMTATSGGATTVNNCAYFSQSGGSSIDLVPPSTGPFAGIILTSSLNCAAPPVGLSGNQAGTATISGGSVTDLFGAIDLPQYSITYSGNSSAGAGCVNIVANSFSISGAASLSNNCTGVGTSGIGPSQTVTTSTSTGTPTYQALLSN